jgi:hypothetical protein
MRELAESGNGYGASMGRKGNVVETAYPVEFEVCRLQWVDGDYDQGGAYWGRTFKDRRTNSGGDFIFRFEGESANEIEEMFVRAMSVREAMDEVRATYPNATFAEGADLEAVYSGYRDAALWSSTNDRHYEDPEEPESLDDSDYELSDEAERHFRTDCAAFLAENADLVVAVGRLGMDGENIGHNFWLSRNGHGTGFWDRGHGEIGDKLHEASKKFGEDDLYVGDDDQIHSYYQHRSAPDTTVEQVASEAGSPRPSI